MDLSEIRHAVDSVQPTGQLSHERIASQVTRLIVRRNMLQQAEAWQHEADELRATAQALPHVNLDARPRERVRLQPGKGELHVFEYKTVFTEQLGFEMRKWQRVDDLLELENSECLRVEADGSLAFYGNDIVLDDRTQQLYVMSADGAHRALYQHGVHQLSPYRQPLRT